MMLYIKNLLLIIPLCPLIGILMLICIPTRNAKLLKIVALNSVCLSFTFSLILWGFFNNSTSSFQFVQTLFWLPLLNLNVSLGVDGISIFFILLTTLLIPLCLLSSWTSVRSNLKEFLIAFLLLDFLLIGAFCALDVLVFYVLYESTLIPMFLIIGVWGSRERKILASYYFFMYTLSGSTLMLLSLLYIISEVGTTNIEILMAFKFDLQEEKILWFTFFLAFATKVPMLPFHLWLPEAHVEAPTGGSILLAGVILKLGVYGLIRFTLPVFPEASFYYAPYVFTLASVSIIYASFSALRQTDFKRTLAYSSIAHMNLVILGVFSFNVNGFEGAIVQSLSHGLCASGLFLAAGIIYERHGTRIIQYYGGLALTMPLYINFFLFFILANMSFPGTSGFVGEFLILAGCIKISTTVAFFGATGIILGSIYSLWLFNRIAYGNFKAQYLQHSLDLSPREVIIFLPLVLGTLLIGICPNVFLNTIHPSVCYSIEAMYF